MRFVPATAALFAACLAALPAAAQAPQPPAGERLLMAPPPNWKPVAVQRTEKMNITRLFPPGQDENKWNEAITIQIYPGSTSEARAFIENIIQYSRANCEAAGPSAVNEAPVNGYPMASVSVACTKGRSSGLGGFVLVQAIRGKDALYVVQRQWRGPAFDKDKPLPLSQDMLKDWSAFSRTVSLCDSRDSRHPCPK